MHVAPQTLSIPPRISADHFPSIRYEPVTTMSRFVAQPSFYYLFILKELRLRSSFESVYRSVYESKIATYAIHQKETSHRN